jgi:hypothetical protein
MANAMEISEPKNQTFNKGDKLRFYPTFVEDAQSGVAVPLKHHTAAVLADGKVYDCNKLTVFESSGHWIMNLPSQDGILYVNDYSPQDVAFMGDIARLKASQKVNHMRERMEFSPKMRRKAQDYEDKAYWILTKAQNFERLHHQNAVLKNAKAFRLENADVVFAAAAVNEVAAPVQPRGRVRDFAPVYDKE